MRFRLPFLSIALIGLVVACSKPSPVAKGANKVTAVPETVNNTATTPAGGPPENKTEPGGGAPAVAPATTIPASLQGRWGLTPADCTSKRGDAKGLLVVTADALRFYESRAVPSADVQTSATMINGTFHFSGEGQTWDRFESLQRNKDHLTRTESGPTASYTYAKC